MIKNKRGISPVIATVLLISLVIVLALIVFFWFRGMTKEAITKFDGENIELACDKVNFKAEYISETLNIVNDGNVPLYDIKVKGVSGGDESVLTTSGIDKGLDQGGSASITVSGASGYDKLMVYPILLGQTETGQTTYVCDSKDEWGIELAV